MYFMLGNTIFSDNANNSCNIVLETKKNKQTKNISV